MKWILNIVLFSMICITACTKIVRTEFGDFEERPVINCLLTDSLPLRVHLSTTRKLDKDSLSGCDDAEVLLFDGNHFVESLSSVGGGQYVSSMLAHTGVTYTLEVAMPNFDKKTLKIAIPQRHKIIDIESFIEGGVDAEGRICPAFSIRFSCDPEKKEYYWIRGVQWENYYAYQDYLAGAMVGTHSKTLRSQSLSFININDPILLQEGLPLYVFSNEHIHSREHTLYVQYRGAYEFRTIHGVHGKVPCPISVELWSIDSSYYHYLKSSYLYEKALTESSIGQVFEAYPLYSNIPGGYGIAGAYSVSVSDTLIPHSKF